MQVHGSSNQQGISEVGGTRMSVSQYFNECKNASMSSPKAVLNAIKYAFSNKAGREEKAAELKSLQKPAQPQVQSQSKPASAPQQLTSIKSLTFLDWAEVASKNTTESKFEGEDAAIEIAKHVHSELKNDFEGWEVINVSYEPSVGTAGTLLELGIVILNPDTGDRKALYGIANFDKDTSFTHEFDRFISEFNKLNK